MTYKDSAEDGEEGSVAGAGEPKGVEFTFPLEAEADSLEERLRFLHAIAKLWRLAARPELWPRAESAGQDALAGWLSTARGTREGLMVFLDRATAIEIPDPPSGHEGMIEFDRRRALKGHILELGVSASVEMGCAARTLAALLSVKPELTEGKLGQLVESAKTDESGWWTTAEVGTPSHSTGEIDVVGDLDRSVGLPGFVALFRTEPLLYCRRPDGAGRTRYSAQTALNVFEDPDVCRGSDYFGRRSTDEAAGRWSGTIRPDGRRVSSFDQLFRTALTGSNGDALDRGGGLGRGCGPDGPLSGVVPTGRSFPGTLGAA